MCFVALVVEAKSVFREFDKDKNGVISAQELGTALRMLGLNPTMKEVQNMINEIDQNGAFSTLNLPIYFFNCFINYQGFKCSGFFLILNI